MIRRIVLSLALVVALVSCEDKKQPDKEALGTVIGIDLGTTYSWWDYLLIGTYLSSYICVYYRQIRASSYLGR